MTAIKNIRAQFKLGMLNQYSRDMLDAMPEAERFVKEEMLKSFKEYVAKMDIFDPAMTWSEHDEVLKDE